MDRPEVRSRGVRPGEGDEEDESWPAGLAADAVTFTDLPERIDVMMTAETIFGIVFQDRLSLKIGDRHRDDRFARGD